MKKYKHIKKTIQQDMRKAYWEFIEKIIFKTLAMRVPSYDGFDVLSADTVIWLFEPGIWSPRFRVL
jgi:hypothetical protein